MEAHLDFYTNQFSSVLRGVQISSEVSYFCLPGSASITADGSPVDFCSLHVVKLGHLNHPANAPSQQCA
jgi:hypothetical protein